MARGHRHFLSGDRWTGKRCLHASVAGTRVFQVDSLWPSSSPSSPFKTTRREEQLEALFSGFRLPALFTRDVQWQSVVSARFLPIPTSSPSSSAVPASAARGVPEKRSSDLAGPLPAGPSLSPRKRTYSLLRRTNPSPPNLSAAGTPPDSRRSRPGRAPASSRGNSGVATPQNAGEIPHLVKIPWIGVYFTLTQGETNVPLFDISNGPDEDQKLARENTSRNPPRGVPLHSEANRHQSSQAPDRPPRGARGKATKRNFPREISRPERATEFRNSAGHCFYFTFQGARQ